ncbi:MAG: PAS domain S-box protein [Methylovirgula sp.]
MSKIAGTLPPLIDFAELVRASGDAIVACDAAGLIILWNPAAERIFGFTESEALGQSLDLIIPERQRQRHWDGYHQTMRTGETRYATDVLKVPALHKDGRTLSIAFTVSLLRSADEPSAIVAIIRDETARWSDERNLRKRLAELEAKLRETAAQNESPAS